MFRRLDPNNTEEADKMAKDIKQKYFNKKYFFGPNSPATREGLDKVTYKKHNPIDAGEEFCVIYTLTTDYITCVVEGLGLLLEISTYN